VPSRRVAVLAALLVLLAGCAEKTQGNPSAGDEPTSQDTTTEPSTSESGTEGVADLDPCTLLSSADLAALALTEQEAKTAGQAKVCQWRHEGATLDETFTIGLAVFEGVGIADIVGSDIQQLPNIGSHQAATYTGTTGGCGVSLGITDKSRVDSTATGGRDQQQGCQLATQLATAVEPKLP
jgi:hypothetical protein